MKFKTKFWLWYVIVCAAFAVLFIIICPTIQEDPKVDKLLHFIVCGVISFFMLLILLSSERVSNSKRLSMWAILFSITFTSLIGIIVEVRQISIPHRNADIADWAFDVIGAAVGACIGWIVGKRRTKDSVHDVYRTGQRARPRRRQIRGVRRRRTHRRYWAKRMNRPNNSD